MGYDEQASRVKGPAHPSSLLPAAGVDLVDMSLRSQVSGVQGFRRFCGFWASGFESGVWGLFLIMGFTLGGLSVFMWLIQFVGFVASRVCGMGR